MFDFDYVWISMNSYRNSCRPTKIQFEYVNTGMFIYTLPHRMVPQMKYI